MSDPRLPVGGEIDDGPSQAEDADYVLDESEDDGGPAADDAEGDAADEGQVADEAAEGDVAAPSQRHGRRDNQRRENLRRENSTLRDSLTQLQQSFIQLQQQVAQRPPQQQNPYQAQQEAQAEAERVANMLPHEQVAYYAQRTEARFQQQLAVHQFNTYDQMDRQNFATSARTSATRERLMPQVEQTLNQFRAQGISLTREQVYLGLLGMETERRATQQAGRQRQQGQRRVLAQTVRPANGRGDVPRGDRGAGQDADERLLRQIAIGDV